MAEVAALAIVVGGGIAIVYLLMRWDERSSKDYTRDSEAELAHQERLAKIERGMDPDAPRK